MVCLYVALLPRTSGKLKGKFQLLHIYVASHSINEVPINILITILYKTEQEEMVIRNWCHKSVTILLPCFAVHWPLYRGMFTLNFIS